MFKKITILKLILVFFSLGLLETRAYAVSSFFSRVFLRNIFAPPVFIRALSSHISWAEKVLGIPRGVSAEEINVAFKKKALECHPDCTGKSCSKRFRELKTAQELMLNYVPRSSSAEMQAPVEGKLVFEDCTADKTYMRWVLEQVRKASNEP